VRRTFPNMYLDRAIEELCIDSAAQLFRAIEVIQRGTKQITLVVDDERRLLGTITDGDVRRSILRGITLDAPASGIMNTAFTTGTVDMTAAEVFVLMRLHSIRHVPLLDAEGRVADLVWVTDLLRRDEADLSAVVMAGGFGKRLRSLTADTPKPMLPMGDRPVMGHLIDQLRGSGIKEVLVTTHFMPEKIMSHFGDGSEHGLCVRYVREETPMGTAGALSLVGEFAKPVLVVNGDIVTSVDFGAMLAFHRENRADLTMGVRQCGLRVPYGVVQTDGVRVVGIREKPRYSFFISAGMYLLEPSVRAHLAAETHMDMPELIAALIAAGRSVVSFPVVEYWMDIGAIDDYERARRDTENGRIRN
jgi:dTDP-glucose pyrophosphorylase